jgi:hypothetical protein
MDFKTQVNNYYCFFLSFFLIIEPTRCTNFCLRAGWGRNSVLNLLASCQQTSMTYTIAVCTVKNPDDGRRNCPKHVEFHSENKCEKLVHLVGSIRRIYHDARSPERQIIIFLFWKSSAVCSEIDVRDTNARHQVLVRYHLKWSFELGPLTVDTGA